MVLRSRIRVIILSSLSSKISLIVTKFSLLSPGVSISFWWFFRGTKIASTFKTWIRVMEGGDHVPIHVILDISKPLCCRRKITLDGGNTGWVSFKYERLPSIWFWCGCLTHGEKDCEQWVSNEGSLTVEDRNYGAWLWAPLSNQIRKSSIDVLGFYQQKKDSKVSKEEGSESSSKPPKASLPKSGTSTKSLAKVTPISVHPNFSNPAAYPSVRDL